MPQQISPAEVEGEILRLSALLETVTEAQADLGMNAGEAEVAYKVAYAKAMLRADGDTAKDREAQATIWTEAELRGRKISEAMHSVNVEQCRTIRAQLDALRTLAANARAQH